MTLSVVSPQSPLVRCLLAPNPGPFTFEGTCTYLVGTGEIAVIDPGPDNETHLQALLQALGGSVVSAILVSHTHLDHSPLAAKLSSITGAPIFGCSAHLTRHAPDGFVDDSLQGLLQRAVDNDYRPDRVLQDGEIINGEDWSLQVIATPGHTMNHLCFRLLGTPLVFSGDHVMGWNTSVIIPIEGCMASYMHSLQRFLNADIALLASGHGPVISDAASRVRALLNHRRAREMDLVEALQNAPQSSLSLRERLYRTLPPVLHRAAQWTLESHLIKLWDEGRVVYDDHLWRLCKR